MTEKINRPYHELYFFSKTIELKKIGKIQKFKKLNDKEIKEIEKRLAEIQKKYSHSEKLSEN